MDPRELDQAKDKWNGWMAPEREKAPGELLVGWLREKTQEYTQSAFSRAETVRAGRSLIDHGSDAAREGILAKRAACCAVAADTDLLERLRYGAVNLAEDAAFASEPERRQALSELSRLYKQALNDLGPPPAAPQMSALEKDAATVVGFRKAKASVLGTDPTDIRLNSWGSWPPGGYNVDSDTRESHPPRARSGGSTYQAQLGPLLEELFRLHDLNGNGTLEEDELIKLNEKIAMLHYGKDTDKTVVKNKFSKLFREKLDPQGRPASFEVFKTYMQQVLTDLDPEPMAQVMILEQFIAEAESARNAFQFASFASVTDAPYMSKLFGADDRTRPTGTLPPCAEETPPPSSTQPKLQAEDPRADYLPGEDLTARIRRLSAEATARREANASREFSAEGPPAVITVTAAGLAAAEAEVARMTEAETTPMFRKNDAIQVWSNGKKTWLDGTVLEAFDAPCIAEGFAVPAGALKVSSAAGKKWIMPEHIPGSVRRKP